MSIIGNSTGEDAVERLKVWLLAQADAHGVKLKPAGYIGKSPQTALVDVIIPGASWQDEAPTLYINCESDYSDAGITYDTYNEDSDKDVTYTLGIDSEASDFRRVLSAVLGTPVLEPTLNNMEIADALSQAPLAEAWDAGACIRLDIGGRSFKVVPL